MSHAINLPDELFEQLEEIAHRQGSQPETVAQEWLRAALRRSTVASDEPEYDPTHDPLMRLAGSIASGDPSWGERHEEYLAEAYADAHEPE